VTTIADLLAAGALILVIVGAIDALGWVARWQRRRGGRE
jgi:hypothetical protein